MGGRDPRTVSDDYGVSVGDLASVVNGTGEGEGEGEREGGRGPRTVSDGDGG